MSLLIRREKHPQPVQHAEQYPHAYQAGEGCQLFGAIPVPWLPPESCRYVEYGIILGVAAAVIGAILPILD